MKTKKIDWDTANWSGMNTIQWLVLHGIDALSPTFNKDQDPTHGLDEHSIMDMRSRVFVNQGWRLTKIGLQAMGKIYNTYQSTSADNRIMTGKILIGMDSAVGGPWGYTNNTIHVFDPVVHFELQMCNGSAAGFVKFKNCD